MQLYIFGQIPKDFLKYFLIFQKSNIRYSTLRGIKIFQKIFPKDFDSFEVRKGLQNEINGIYSTHKNSVFEIIIDSINQYLTNNKGAVSDFHLIKDIVDRNCDALEEEIHTQIPVPLYLGLVGTMTGILVGVGFLVFDGGLKSLLNSAASEGADGIEALLGGVAMAMVSSIIGIILSTYGALRAKSAKANVESNKNTFLSWIQAELLPNLPNDISGALVRMSENLNDFNLTFHRNTHEFKATLEETRSLNKSQAELYRWISELKIRDIATANIEVYEKLKSCTDEIGLLGGYLKNVREYSSEFHDVITGIQNYFKEELSQIEQRKGYIAEAVGKVDDYLQQSFQKLKESAEKQLDEYKLAVGEADDIFLNSLTQLEEHVKSQFIKLTETTDAHQESFKKSLLEIEKALQGKLQETSSLVEELKSLTEIKKAVSSFEKIIEKQNGKIDDLTKSINELAKAKTSGEIKVTPEMPEIPKWVKFSAITVGSLISVTCIIVITPILIEWITNLIN
jgi:hypothetical protein